MWNNWMYFRCWWAMGLSRNYSHSALARLPPDITDKAVLTLSECLCLEHLDKKRGGCSRVSRGNEQQCLVFYCFSCFLHLSRILKFLDVEYKFALLLRIINWDIVLSSSRKDQITFSDVSYVHIILQYTVMSVICTSRTFCAAILESRKRAYAL
jgi:hypothetical protein